MGGKVKKSERLGLTGALENVGTVSWSGAAGAVRRMEGVMQAKCLTWGLTWGKCPGSE